MKNTSRCKKRQKDALSVTLQHCTSRKVDVRNNFNIECQSSPQPCRWTRIKPIEITTTQETVSHASPKPFLARLYKEQGELLYSSRLRSRLRSRSSQCVKVLYASFSKGHISGTAH